MDFTAGSAFASTLPRKSQSHPGLGAAIRQLRGSMTQEELAFRSGLTVPWISRLENGAINPQWSTVLMVAKGLGVRGGELADLAERLEDEKSPPAAKG